MGRHNTILAAVQPGRCSANESRNSQSNLNKPLISQRVANILISQTRYIKMHRPIIIGGVNCTFSFLGLRSWECEAASVNSAVPGKWVRLTSLSTAACIFDYGRIVPALLL